MSIKVNDEFHISSHEVIQKIIFEVLIKPNKTELKCEARSGTTLDPGHSCWYPANGSTIELRNVSHEELNRWRNFIDKIKPYLNQAFEDEFEKGKKHGVDLLGQLNRGEITLNEISF
ncbi:hypothetical protein [Tenacibaculum maritimum]|uniref:hypothetical protein n=1 Tax=Tenacibaculum maritimum TaxID=107401 RepID=UPI0012E42009|nr:hypothetical protein [Tenacibaculum maritimum]CAA0254490.1 hypothetical protein TMP445_80034 [Tenacibaculum maritimum]